MIYNLRSTTLKLYFRLQLFSQAATDYIKKLFWEVVEKRKQIGETNDKDLVNHLLKLKDNLKLPAESGTGKQIRYTLESIQSTRNEQMANSAVTELQDIFA